MKIALISDIHGNAVALDAVLNDIRKKEIENIFVLGDICYRGPEPKRSLELVRSLNSTVIKGNADEWVVRGVKSGEVPQKDLSMMNIERDWTFSKLLKSELDYLESLPTQFNLEIEGVEIFGFHATPNSLFEVIPHDVENKIIEEKIIKAIDAQIYVYAHIHKPFIRYIDGKVIMNIGSVGLPFDGMSKASYGLIEIEADNINTTIQRVPYDVEQVISLYQESDYPNKERMIDIIKRGKL